MRHKTDIALAATSARSYDRRWRAKRLSWNAIGKIRYLFDGAVEYMDPVTLCYPQLKFNELRKALGFKQDSELTDLIEQSEAFRIVRSKETGQMMAFMTPLVPDRFEPTDSQEIIEPAIQEAGVDLVMDCDELSYMASSGLRIIQKTMRAVMMKRGKFKMVNVSPEIYKVLNMTGFTKFMAVEQKA